MEAGERRKLHERNLPTGRGFDVPVNREHTAASLLTVEMKPSGSALISGSVPIENVFDKVERRLGVEPPPRQRSRWVRPIRRIAAR